jgi:hypothetical protein
MTEQRGTLEGLVGQLTTILSGLSELTPDAAPQFLAQLGLPLTAAQAKQLAPTLGVTTGGVGDLADLTVALDVAVDAGQAEQVLKKVADAGERIAALLSGLGQLGSHLSGLNLPNAGPILATFGKRLFNLLLAQYVGRDPTVAQLLEFLGILARTDHNLGPIDPQKPFYTQNEFHLDRIAGWVSDPAGQLTALYDWGGGGFDGKKILQLVDRLAAEAGLPSLYDPTAVPPVVDVVFAALTAQTAISPRGLALHLPLGLAPATHQLTGSRWTFTVKLDTNIPADTALVLQPGKITLQPPDSTTVSGTASVEYRYVRDSADPLLLISIAGGSRISVEEITASVALHAAPGGATTASIGAQLKRGQVRITTGGSDGFIAMILGGLDIESNFDLGATFSIADGLHFQGSGALEIQLASHITLGPVDISSLTLLIGVEGGSFLVGLTADLMVSLGPLIGVVQGIGVEVPLSLKAANNGNLGPIDVHPRFRPPKGIGLSLDLDVVSGGGFLAYDEDREEYAGALELSLLDIVTVKAIGLLTTKMPDGSSGFSLLIILTADFGSGFQLGMGFTLNAVGGLVGVNRTMLFQPLMDGVRSGSIESIMFPKDVVANAPKIISDLRAIFPPQQDTFLVGPMAKLGWGQPTLVSLSLGVIIEIPPGDIAILGILRIALPADELAIIELQVNFAGALEFSKKRIYFFAALFDSHVLFITLEGEMGLLVAWGDNADFVVSIGGFHPQFNPPPLPFPSPKRIAVNIINESYARIHCEGYFAVTSNTVQFGSHAEFFFGFDALSASGHSSFDALIQFSPFHFVVSISTAFSVEIFGAGIFGIDISLEVSGPTPWHASGSASISLLFFDVDVDISFTFGDSRDTTLPPVKVMPILSAELGKQVNWRAIPPAGSNLLVSLRALGETEAQFVLHPVGKLQVSQRAVPLDLTLDKLGNSKPSDANRFTLTVASAGLNKTRDLQESFAPAQYKNLGDAARLSQPAYAPQDSGIELSASGHAYGSGTAICRIVRYDVIVLDTKLRRTFLRMKAFAGALFHHGLRGNSASRSSLSRRRETLTHPFAGSVRVNPETFTVAWQASNTAYHATAAGFTSQSSAQDFMNRAVAADPSLAGTLHVLPQFEVVG